MYAPRAKFERVYVVSPIKVAIIFLTCLHCLFIIIALLTSFWIETAYGHYGPLASCEKVFNGKKSLVNPIQVECRFGQSIHDKNRLWMPLTTTLLIISILFAILSIITARLSFVKNSFKSHRRYWLCTIIFLLFVFLIDCFVIIFIPVSHINQKYYLQWAYGVHCGATLFISASLITAILTHNTDDFQYEEA